jgi:hypothetical protein
LGAPSVVVKGDASVEFLDGAVAFFGYGDKSFSSFSVKLG